MTEKTHTCDCHQETCGMKELEKNIGHVPVFFRGLAESDPSMHEAILKLDTSGQTGRHSPASRRS